jgi:putative transposase
MKAVRWSILEMSQKRGHILPTGKEVMLSPHTIKRWYQNYMKGGLEALEPKQRCDFGVSRALTEQVIERIHEIKEDFPHITGKLVYLKLLEEGIIQSKNLSLSTVLRYIRDHHLKSSQMNPEETKAFELEFANDCWQADSSTGPILTINGVKKKTYIIAIIDDASRLIPHIEIFFNDNALNVQKVFRKAVTKYGIPKRFYVDNGGPYKNEQLKYICASLGTALIHHPPYKPNRKGKVERAFRTVKDKWMNGVNWRDFEDIYELNKDLMQFMDRSYTNEVHSSLKQTPRERYLKDFERIKYLPKEEIDFRFLHRITRKVNKDATFQINKNIFEAPQKYIRQTIHLKYDPEDLSKAWITDQENKVIDEVKLLNKTDNSKIKRRKMDYTKSLEGENES